jgi:hypothetical protein
MKIPDHKDAIYHVSTKDRLYVETAIHRASCFNRTVLKIISSISKAKKFIGVQDFVPLPMKIKLQIQESLHLLCSYLFRLFLRLQRCI